MTAHLLPYAQIIILQKDIAEVIINEGVKLDLEMLAEIREVLSNNLKKPIFIVN